MRREVKEYWKEVHNAEAQLDDVLAEMYKMENDFGDNMIFTQFVEYKRLDREREGWIDVRDYWLDKIAQARGFKEWNDYAFHEHEIMLDIRVEQGNYAY